MAPFFRRSLLPIAVWFSSVSAEERGKRRTTFGLDGPVPITGSSPASCADRATGGREPSQGRVVEELNGWPVDFEDRAILGGKRRIAVCWESPRNVAGFIGGEGQGKTVEAGG